MSVSICAQCSSKLDHPKRCSKCKSAYYCNDECQRLHWSVHKADCGSYDAAAVCTLISKAVCTSTDRAQFTHFPLGICLRVRNYREVKEAQNGVFAHTQAMSPKVLAQVRDIPPLSATGFNPKKHVIIFIEVFQQGTRDQYQSLAMAIGRDPKDDFFKYTL